MNPSPKPSFRRQRWVVEPEYQWKMTRMLVIALLLVVVATLLMMFYALTSTIGDVELWPGAVFMAVFKAVAWMIIVEMVVLIPIVIAIGLIVTHRVVGPLSRMKTALDRIGQGQYDVHLKLRGGDVLIELAASIEQLAKTLRDRSSHH